MIGDERAWTDGHEELILTTLQRADDVSARSDELAAHATDWATAYHFSRLRPNILEPIAITAGQRVLDIGCGSGSILRAVGELGAEAVGLEESPSRAQCARERCRDLPNVDVRVGPVQSFNDPRGFDVVLLIGVLEYAAPPGPEGALALLAHARRLLAPGGRIVVAIENQIGLKYVVGYDEDHAGIPWAGIEGYRRQTHAHTFTRRRLRQLLDDAGFAASQQWFYAFPDYKVPRTIASDRLFDDACSDALVALFLSDPTAGDPDHPRLACDAGAALRTMHDAGLARDTANSFLVIAGGPATAVDHGPALWHFSREGAARWLRTRRLVLQPTGPALVCDVPDESRAGWVRHVIPGHEPVLLGETIESLTRGAIIRGDAAATVTLLRGWDTTIRRAVDERPSSGPFAPADGAAPALSGAEFDCLLSNAVRDDHGVIHAIDREWVADGSVDADLVRLRALTHFVIGLVDAGIRIPWLDAHALPRDAVELFARDVGVHPSDDWPDRLIAAESEFQSIVDARDTHAVVEAQIRRIEHPWDDASPIRPIAASLQELAAAKLLIADQEETIRSLRREMNVLETHVAPIEILAAVQEQTLQDILTSPTWRIAEATKTPLRKLRVLKDPRRRSARMQERYKQPVLPAAGAVPVDEIIIERPTKRGLAGANVAVIAAYDVRGTYGAAVEHMVGAFQDLGWRTVVSYSTAVDSTTLGPDRRLPDVLISRDHRGAGYDFFSWRAALELCPELRAASRIVMVNDSIIGPITSLDPLIARLDSSAAAVIGFAESADPFPHIQSWGIAFSGAAIEDRAVEEFYSQAGLDWPKESIIPRMEVPLGTWFARRGYAVEAICSPVTLAGEVRNPSIFGWQGLIRAGVPFVKRELFIKPEETIDMKPREVLQQARRLAVWDIDPLVRDSLASVGASAELIR